jgi:hypothetical protein
MFSPAMQSFVRRHWLLIDICGAAWIGAAILLLGRFGLWPC